MEAPVPGPGARRRIVLVGFVLVAASLATVFVLSPLAGARRSGPLAFFGVAAVIALGAAVIWMLAVRPARRGGGQASPVMAVAQDARPVPPPVRPIQGPVKACVRCGSRDLAIPGIRDGVWAGGGELQFMVCRNCNTRSPPLEFETGEEYAKFVRALHEPGSN